MNPFQLFLFILLIRLVPTLINQRYLSIVEAISFLFAIKSEPLLVYILNSDLVKGEYPIGVCQLKLLEPLLRSPLKQFLCQFQILVFLTCDLLLNMLFVQNEDIAMHHRLGCADSLWALGM